MFIHERNFNEFSYTFWFSGAWEQMTENKFSFTKPSQLIDRIYVYLDVFIHQTKVFDNAFFLLLKVTFSMC